MKICYGMIGNVEEMAQWESRTRSICLSYATVPFAQDFTFKVHVTFHIYMPPRSSAGVAPDIRQTNCQIRDACRKDAWCNGNCFVEALVWTVVETHLAE